MTMRASTRERILEQAWAAPLGLLRLDEITAQEVLKAAGGQSEEDCLGHELSNKLWNLADRLQGLSKLIRAAEDQWIRRASGNES